MKKTTNRLLLAAALFAATLLSSCKKDSSNGSSSKIKLLASGTWNVSVVEYQKKDGIWVNEPNFTPYSLTFRDDNTVTAVTGSTVTVKAWNTSDDFAHLNIVGTTGSGNSFTVTQLTSSSLQMTLPVSGTTYINERDTFTH